MRERIAGRVAADQLRARRRGRGVRADCEAGGAVAVGGMCVGTDSVVQSCVRAQACTQREPESQRDSEAERQRDSETETQRDRATEPQSQGQGQRDKDSETARQRNRETEGQGQRVKRRDRERQRQRACCIYSRLLLVRYRHDRAPTPCTTHQAPPRNTAATAALLRRARWPVPGPSDHPARPP